MPDSIKTKLVSILKIFFISLLLYFLIQKGFVSMSSMRSGLENWQHCLPAVVACFFSAFLAALRWQLLLRTQHIHLPFFRSCQFTWIGYFFNIALPGAVSGDFIKALYIGKETPGKKSQAFGAILFDRVSGLSALILVSAGALLTSFSSFSESTIWSAIQSLVVSGAVGFLFFYIYLFLVKEQKDPLLKLLSQIETQIPRLQSLRRIYESLRSYHQNRQVVIQALALSTIIQLTAGWTFYEFALALGESQIRLQWVYIVAPLGLLVTAIPIAPAGVGTGNLAFLYFFSLIGSERGADIFSLYALSQILISLSGGLVYLRFTSRKKPFLENHGNSWSVSETTQ